MSDARKQYIFRADHEAQAAIADLQRLDRDGPVVPSANEAIRRAVIERCARLRKAQERRK
jgi:hypothetical protein